LNFIPDSESAILFFKTAGFNRSPPPRLILTYEEREFVGFACPGSVLRNEPFEVGHIEAHRPANLTDGILRCQTQA
jgi:hypothetical protein